MTLYEMTETANYLYRLLEDGEIDEQTVADSLEGLGVGDKLEDYCKVIRQFEADKAAYEAEKNKLADDNGNIPALNEILLPIRDGDIDRYYDPEYANCWFINATTKFAPYIFDTDHNLITDHKQVYSGVYGKANVHFYAFHAKERNQRGIVCCIDSLMKVRDGDSLGQSNSFKTALDEFIEDEKENPNW
jgi:hypothetical protein